MGFLTRFRRVPVPAATEASTVAPVENKVPLHILSDDVVLRLSGGVLQAGDARMVLNDLSSVSLYGSAGLTAPALRALCGARVPVLVHSRAGYPFGWCVPAGQGTSTRRAQYAAFEASERRVSLARAVIEAKLSATLRLARRRGASDRCLSAITRARHALPRARSLAQIMGHEGAAAAAWMAEWPHILRADRWFGAFAGRTRRPARDGLNAAVSYGYACITGQCVMAALAAGLDPSLGMLHAPRAGRAAMALDLSEPFRVAIC
ncbi:MAG: CRISPR-associated endonuclease Cas1 [Shimia sp.]